MDEFTVLEGADPVDRRAVERALSHAVFDELFDQLVADPVERSVEPVMVRRFPPRRSARRRWPVLVAVAAAVVVVLSTLAGVGVLGGGGLGRSFTTSWKAARPFVHASSRGATTRRGTWRLVDDLLTGSWQQNVYGPPPGQFSCSPAGACYVLAGKYLSASAAAPVSESLYVTTDDGATWTVLPLPSGFLTTTPLECSGAQWCAAGGSYDGQPVLAVTRDGGHAFTIDPLPTGVGTLRSLSCPSTGVCAGLVATGHTPPSDATLLVTDDGGSTFHDEPIVAGDSMIDLACASSRVCTVVGSTGASVDTRVPVGVSAVTTNQGRTWTSRSLPTGFGINADSTSLACADAQHCFVTGSIPIPVHNPAKCASMPNRFKTPPPGTHGMPAMSPQVAAISKVETKLAAAAAAKEQVTTGVTSCTNGRVTTVADVASSSDGGLTWTPEMLPSDVPKPRLDGLSCPTATECWAAGTELVREQVGKTTDMSSPVLIGTTDGGSTWSKVVFSVPATAPDTTGQSYISMGSVTCPTTRVCLARGGAAEGSGYAAVYSLVVPGG
ncbi:MAG: hypothetical protein M0Z46_16345 [Actinomycetota bacterium]|nr:hypothetical protein [Actinomycetota bacterium]